MGSGNDLEGGHIYAFQKRLGNQQTYSQEECRLLEYKNPVLTSQETRYDSATESSQLILCMI
jgi:hypothetical protein